MANITELNQRLEDCVEEAQDIKDTILETAEDFGITVVVGTDTPLSVLEKIKQSGGGTYELTEKDISDSMLYYDLEVFGGVTMPTQAEYSSQYASYYKLAQKHMQGGSQ